MSLQTGGKLFLGAYPCRVDGKGRVSFPASFRSALTARGSAGVSIFLDASGRGIEGITQERMEMLAEAMEETPSDSRMHLQMMVFSQSVDLAIDKEGRCSIPRSMLDDVAIESELVFSGNGNTFSICSPAEFERRKAEAREAVVVKKTAVMPALPRGIL